VLDRYGPRALFWLAIVTWIWVRLPVLEQFTYTLAHQPTQAVANDLPIFLSLGEALAQRGWLGWYDQGRTVPVPALGDLNFDQGRVVGGAADWRMLDYNDWGFETIVLFSRWLPGADGVLAIVALQYFVDAICLALVCWIGTRLVSPWAGAAAAMVYALHPTLASLVNQPYYYYWNMVASVAALACWVALYDGPQRTLRSACFYAGLSGAVIGFSSLVRTTNEALLPLFVLLLLVRERISWRFVAMSICLVAAAVVVLTPLVLFKYRAHGRIQFRGKEVFWHTVLTGLGTHDNPWGLEWKDEVAFERIQRKYGVSYDTSNLRPYEEAARQEVMALYRERPDIFTRNFQRNILWGLKFRSAIPADQDIASVHRTLNNVRLLAWVGLAWLLWRGPRYYALVLLLLLVYPVLIIAPFTAPNFAYSSAMFGPEAILAGLGMYGIAREVLALAARRPA